MDNIYRQDEFKRNSIVELPEGFAEKSGNTLYSWLGSLWRGLHKGDEMIRGLQASRGIRLAQLYLNILEAASLKDRYGAPVFHRELWHPIVIRKSECNKSQENLINIGIDGDIGAQKKGSEYGEGTVFRMGRMVDRVNFVTYPISEGIAGGALSIVDNIINPKIYLYRGVDKDYEIRNNTIIFKKEHDPFASESPYEKIDIPGNSDNPDSPDYFDVEIVLWASDVLFDRNYIYDHISYVLGTEAPSSDVVKRILNAAWSSVSCGLSPELLRTLIAAMLNIPVIQEEHETVVDIIRGSDNVVVLTDCGSYSVSPKARLMSYVYSGSVLNRGDLLDESLRIYPFLNVSRSDVNTGFSVPVELDIPSVVLPSDILRVKTEYGVYATWWKSKVMQSERMPYDSNGNPKLYFEIGGIDSDVSAFWNDVWEKSERDGLGMDIVFGGGKASEFSPDATYSAGNLVLHRRILYVCSNDHHGKWSESDFSAVEISPAEFFLKNLVGANTLFIIVDGSQLDDTSMMRDPMFFDMLSNVVPSAIRMFVVEHLCAGDDDKANMGDAKEGKFLAASLPDSIDGFSESAPQVLEGRNPSFGDHVSMRLVRTSPKKTRIRKSEREEKWT